MGKRLEYTPRSKVRSALRQLFLRSRERAQALKNTGYCCAECGVKQSKAKGKEVKIEVHHVEGARLEALIDLVYEYLLCNPVKLKPLCEKCHSALCKDCGHKISEHNSHGCQHDYNDGEFSCPCGGER